MVGPVRVVLLVNESSGSGSGPSGREMAAVMRAEGAEPHLMPADRPGEAAAVRPDRIVVATGDGGVAPAAEAAGAAGVPLAVVPNGTANDFARRMGLPDDPVAACRLAVHGGALRTLDLGWLGDRPFVNAVSAGLSVRATQRAGALKPLLGPAAYAAGAVRAAVTARPLRCTVTCDGRQAFSGRAWQVMVACSGGFGGGSRIAEADPSDGLLDLVVLPAGSRLRLARDARTLRAGRIGDRPGVTHARAREVVLELPPGEGLNLDGDVVPAGPALRVDPARFRLVVS